LAAAAKPPESSERGGGALAAPAEMVAVSPGEADLARVPSRARRQGAKARAWTSHGTFLPTGVAVMRWLWFAAMVLTWLCVGPDWWYVLLLLAFFGLCWDGATYRAYKARRPDASVQRIGHVGRRDVEARNRERTRPA